MSLKASFRTFQDDKKLPLNHRIPQSREQKHVLLFRKSTLRGCYKPRHVTKQDMLVFEYLNFKLVTCLDY